MIDANPHARGLEIDPERRKRAAVKADMEEFPFSVSDSDSLATTRASILDLARQCSGQVSTIGAENRADPPSPFAQFIS